jgi:hypothetical protein
MWRTSIGSLMGAADGRDFVMHSRIGVLHALNRNVKGLFNSGHKDTLGKARKKKTVQGISESWAEAEGKLDTIRECGRFITVSWFFRWNSRFDSRVSAASISF